MRSPYQKDSHHSQSHQPVVDGPDSPLMLIRLMLIRYFATREEVCVYVRGVHVCTYVRGVRVCRKLLVASI